MSTGAKKLVAAWAVALFALAGCSNADAPVAQPFTGSPAPGYWTKEYVSALFREVPEDDFELGSCGFGAEFYESVGLRFVKTERTDEFQCSGWYTTEQGEVEVLIAFSESTKRGTLSEEPGLKYWYERYENDGVCRMTNLVHRLSNVELAVQASCEALYPLARQLTNLKRQFDSFTDDSDAWETAEFLDPDPRQISIAGPEYGQRVYDAMIFGEPGAMPAVELEGATLTPHDVYFAEMQDENGREFQAICVKTSFYYGEPNAEFDRLILKPDLFILLPHDEALPLPPVRYNAETPAFASGLVFGGAAHEELEREFCREWPSGIRGASLVLASTGLPSAQV